MQLCNQKPRKATALPSDLIEHLRPLATEINAAHVALGEAFVSTCEALLEAGKAKAMAGYKLLEARAMCRHGEWLTFLKHYCPAISQPTAWRYMQFSERWEAMSADLQRVANYSQLNNLERLTLCKRLLAAACISDEDEQPRLAQATVEPKQLLKWAGWLTNHAPLLHVETLGQEARQQLRQSLEPAVRLWEELGGGALRQGLVETGDQGKDDGRGEVGV
jgi:hypothetical protein